MLEKKYRIETEIGSREFSSREEAAAFVRRQIGDEFLSRVRTATKLTELVTALDDFRNKIKNTQVRLIVEGKSKEVYLCRRPADITGFGFVDHHWIRTSKYEAGMGGECPVPGQDCSDRPYVSTITKDHSGQSDYVNARCELVPDVDEDCVNGRIEPGRATGWWTPVNQCQSFASRIIFLCRTK